MPAEQLLLHVGECLDSALAQATDRAAQVKVVGVSCFWHALLGLDKTGRPLTPIYNWADSRAGQAANLLRNRLDVREVHARTGCILHPSYYPAKIQWLRQTRPEICAQVAAWASPGEYLFRQWFGDLARQVSVSMASGTGLLNQKTGQWDADTLQEIALPAETLPSIAAEKELARGLTKGFADRWPALKNVPFLFPIGDGACGNIGSGCALPDRFAINVGTSGAIRAVWREKAEDAPQLNTPLACGATAWTRIARSWRGLQRRRQRFRVLEQYLKTAAAGRIGSPTFRAGAGGQSAYLSAVPRRRTQPGLAFRRPRRSTRHEFRHGRAGDSARGLRSGRVPLHAGGAAPQIHFSGAKQVIASGGALAKSPYWAQTFADCLGQTLILAEEPKQAAAGRPCSQWRRRKSSRTPRRSERGSVAPSNQTPSIPNAMPNSSPHSRTITTDSSKSRSCNPHQNTQAREIWRPAAHEN